MDAVELGQLEELLARAAYVTGLDELNAHLINKLPIGPDAIFMRHDVDSQGWQATLPIAQWEAERGYRSTFYFLPDTNYWGPGMEPTLREIADLGHEIGYHNNSLALSRYPILRGVRPPSDPFAHLERTVGQLREWSGQPVLSTAAHGDGLCSKGSFSNFQLFVEGNVGSYVGNTYKGPAELGFEPRPLADFGFTFMGDWLPRPHYVTDSGGSFDYYAAKAKYHFIHNLTQALEAFPWKRGYLVILQHPDHWKDAFPV